MIHGVTSTHSIGINRLQSCRSSPTRQNDLICAPPLASTEGDAASSERLIAADVDVSVKRVLYRLAFGYHLEPDALADTVGIDDAVRAGSQLLFLHPNIAPVIIPSREAGWRWLEFMPQRGGPEAGYAGGWPQWRFYVLSSSGKERKKVASETMTARQAEAAQR